MTNAKHDGTETAPLGPEEFGKRSVRNPENWHKVRQAFEARSEHTEGMPILLHVEASAECNMQCPFCPRGMGLIARKGFLALEDFDKVFTVLSPTLCNVVFSGWGEPLLNPGIFAMIKQASSQGIPVAMNTNGVLIGEYAEELVASGLGIVNISLDGAVSKTTHSYADDQVFTDIIDGVSKLRKLRDERGANHPLIHGQFIVDEETVDEIAELRAWAFQIGADHVKFKRRHEIMPGQINRNEQRPAEELQKIDAHEFVDSSENRAFCAKACAHPWESLFLASTGNLSICSWDPHQKISLGTIPDTFDELWNGTAVQMLRSWHSQNTLPMGDPCRTCNRLPGYLRFDDAESPTMQMPDKGDSSTALSKAKEW